MANGTLSSVLLWLTTLSIISIMVLMEVYSESISVSADMYAVAEEYTPSKGSMMKSERAESSPRMHDALDERQIEDQATSSKYFGMSSQYCATETNNYTNFCPVDETRSDLKAMRKKFPELFRISRDAVYRKLSGKVILLAGDSVAGQHYLSLCCVMATNETDIIMQTGPTWIWRVQWFHRKPIRCAIIQATTICYIKGATIWSTPWMSDVLALAKHLLSPDDILVLNTGLHFSPSYGSTSHWPEFKIRINSLIREIECVKPEFKVYFRENSAQHFATSRGGWYPGSVPKRNGSNYGCHPHENTRNDTEAEKLGYHKGHPEATPDYLVKYRSILEDAGYRTIEAWDVSREYWRLHTSYTRVDCTHVCLPGVPDIWTLRLLSDIASGPENESSKEPWKPPPSDILRAERMKEHIEHLYPLLANLTALRTDEKVYRQCHGADDMLAAAALRTKR
mmetsp:Transcript_2977/g.4390  ORF Transcript_2977/g.4390 Transcript_2977/m.4390 type:complete len:452 (+) Transcript_2977:98-1453(+)|eukprot:CAMPEP_0167740034 /NCGR_PEP_ID=MMETSP0110_2-20121227/52_1 /TAXON_ID=629695 /ORGANISM="Gymnochlora sp., Strain CCMP2014" /LENGTH=451 /DNA_ID=CAMNT_0007623881 /DNA_START=20 /DNA_END=1375 /DNA_ORIENTATION=-